MPLAGEEGGGRRTHVGHSLLGSLSVHLHGLQSETGIGKGTKLMGVVKGAVFVACLQRSVRGGANIIAGEEE